MATQEQTTASSLSSKAFFSQLLASSSNAGRKSATPAILVIKCDNDVCPLAEEGGAAVAARGRKSPTGLGNSPIACSAWIS